jgi:hypothetical protein
MMSHLPFPYRHFIVFVIMFLPPPPKKVKKLRQYTLRPKIFALFDFYITHFTIRLIQNICENTKIIMIYLKYIRR